MMRSSRQSFLAFLLLLLLSSQADAAGGTELSD